MKLKGAKLVLGLFGSFWSLFLSYKILEHINATELMWFLYWVFIPLCIVMGILHTLVEE